MSFEIAESVKHFKLSNLNLKQAFKIQRFSKVFLSKLIGLVCDQYGPVGEPLPYISFHEGRFHFIQLQKYITYSDIKPNVLNFRI